MADVYSAISVELRTDPLWLEEPVLTRQIRHPTTENLFLAACLAVTGRLATPVIPMAFEMSSTERVQVPRLCAFWIMACNRCLFG